MAVILSLFRASSRVESFEDPSEREIFVNNLQARIHLIIEMIWWTGHAPWEFEFPFPGGLTSTAVILSLFRASSKFGVFLSNHHVSVIKRILLFSSLLLSSLKLGDTKVYEP